MSHYGGLAKMLLELLEALDPPICDLATFLRIEHHPLPAMEFLVEVKDEIMMDEVHESVAHICLILVVDRNVEEVILPLVILVDLLQELTLTVLVWDVLDHYCGPGVLTILDPLNVDHE